MNQQELNKIARYFIKKYSLKTLKDTGEILYYDNSKYENGGEKLLETQIEKRYSPSTRECTEIINKVRRKTYTDREKFDSNSYLLNLKNGLFDLKSGKFTEHTPRHLSRVQLPVKYNKMVGPKKFVKFLIDVLPDDKDRITFLEEMASAIIPIKLEKIYVHVGKGGNGKSTAFEVLNKFLGIGNTSHASLQDLLYNRFARAELDGKLVNTCADISREEINDTSLLKMLVSGDPIMVERKNQNPFYLRNRARLFFSANKMPHINDNSYGHLRKLIVTKWTRKFKNNPTQEDIKDGVGTINPNLIKELTTASELSGILNLLIVTAKRLMRQGYFTYEQSAEQIDSEWLRNVDSHEIFLDTCLEKDPQSITPCRTVGQFYLEWCEKNHIIPKSETVLNAKIQKKFGAEKTTSRIDGQPTKAWRGIRLNKLEQKVAVCN